MYVGCRAFINAFTVQGLFPLFFRERIGYARSQICVCVCVKNRNAGNFPESIGKNVEKPVFPGIGQNEKKRRKKKITLKTVFIHIFLDFYK